jgi:3-oxoacyl-[acyl-carrier protein] reductase
MRIAVIGGSSSIGRAVVERLASRGDAVLATHLRHPQAERAGVQATHLDLRDEQSMQAFARLARSHGPLDAVLLLAAVLPGKSLVEYDFRTMHEVMSINLTAPARLLALLLPELAAGAQVLLMSSSAGTRGSYDPLYAASKAGLIGLMKSLALWHGKQARFNCLAPALVEGSAMERSMSEEVRARHRADSPTGALVQLEDLAQAIVDLTGPHWSHLNGAVIPLDGGRK